ncbi:ABC transporter permease [Apilactobacillus apisilvae]|uniref:ABC transporter permease n=1 Tax=Apilactobacillus apisilvae TaxID=2923364 RepID=A0ABY4PFW8_9LACO|nr:ABC transporter permease [Apilactobacillus apisilvae]UQS84512.1 ABC transporter permease [Apilactobacillus apisilvae]
MLTLIRQEMYKQIHGKFYIGWSITMLVISLIGGYLMSLTKHVPDKPLEVYSMGIALMIFAMIAFASTIITGDFANNTVKYLFARQFSRLSIFMSKIVVMLIMFIYLNVVNFVVTYISKLIFLSDSAIKFKPIINSMFGNMWFLLLLIPMVILVSNIAKNNGVAIAFGIVFYFAASIIGSYLTYLIDKVEIIKWNPLNFLSTNEQFADHSVSTITHLSLTQMEIGTVVYALIFTAIAYTIYNHRNV